MSDLINLVHAAIQQGDSVAARRILTQIVKNNPSDAKAWRLLAEIVTDPIERTDCLERIRLLAIPDALGPRGDILPVARPTAQSDSGSAGMRRTGGQPRILLAAIILIAVLALGGAGWYLRPSTKAPIDQAGTPEPERFALTLVRQAYGQDAAVAMSAFVVKNDHANVVGDALYQITFHPKAGEKPLISTGVIDLVLPGQEFAVVKTVDIPTGFTLDRAEITLHEGEARQISTPIAPIAVTDFKSDTAYEGTYRDPKDLKDGWGSDWRVFNAVTMQAPRYPQPLVNLTVTVIAYDQAGVLLGGGMGRFAGPLSKDSTSLIQTEVYQLGVTDVFEMGFKDTAKIEAYVGLTKRSLAEFKPLLPSIEDHPEWMGEDVMPDSARIPGHAVYALNESYRYTTNPPAWGPYACIWAHGRYTTAPADPVLVRTLKDGGAVISYDPDQLSFSDLQSLGDLYNELAPATEAPKINAPGPQLVLTPREGMETPVAVAAWGYLLKLDTLDLEAIRGFYQIHGPDFSHQCS